MLIQRTISSIILIGILLGTVFIFPMPLVVLVIGLVVGIGQWEFYGLTELKGFKPFKIFGTVMGIILSITTYYGIDTYITLSFILLIALIKHAFKKEGYPVIDNSAVTMLGILYVSFLFTFIIKIRFIPNPQEGKGWIMALFIITKVSDACAYIFGTSFGRNKLIPRISAKKTVEGSIAGLIGAVMISLLLGKKWLLGVLLSIAGQVGDLIESLIKRDAQIKDSGRLVPGIGGVLDLIDSLLFAGPAMYIYLHALY